MNEKQLIQALRKGNEKAFEHLVTSYQNRLLAIAFGITLDREESLEIIQDVFVSVFRNIHEFREEAGLMTWMRKITVNMCLNWKRKWIRRFKWDHQPIETENGHIIPEAENVHSASAHDTPESYYMAQEFENHVIQSITMLPEKMRTVFVLNVIENLPYEEIAQTLNIKIGTVKSRIYHARRFLAEKNNRGG